MVNETKTQFSARKRLIVVAISACFASAPAWGNPSAPQVVNGAASFNQAGNLLTVNNSNGAIINWNTFSIGAGETTRFNQSSAASSVLNRVLANDPSVLLGTLSSNGKVWLVNPAGIMVGQGARIDVAGFIASTLNVRNEDFLANRLNFQATPNAGSIQNYGQITTPSGGSVYLVAPNVENHGVINAPNGEVLLAAGQTVQLLDTGTPGVKVDITGAEGNATNLGEIVSEAGRIGMAGVLVKNSGTLNASSLVKEGGRIFLKASQDAYVDGAGRIVATGTKGGSIEVLGNNVTMAEQAVIDASGELQEGGNILLKADMSAGTATVAGSLLAKGGASGGDGGFIETSGAHVKIADSAQVSTSAPNGQAGTWLIDPTDYTIAPGGDTTGALLSNSLGTSPGYGGNVTILSSYGGTSGFGDIYVNDTVSWNSANSLTLNAFRDVAVNSNVTNLGTGAINLYSATGTAGGVKITSSTVSTGGAVAVTGTGLIVASTGAVNSGADALLQGLSMTATLSDTITVSVASTGSTAKISTTGGTQTLSANQILISARTSGFGMTAGIIAQGGEQLITLTGTAPLLRLTGGGSGGSDNTNWAELALESGTGNQTITFNSGGAVQITGGNGSGSFDGFPFTSDNHAGIYNRGTGTQTIQTIAGTSGITLTGGTVGTNNHADIYSNGAQIISAADSIALTGGASGGTTTYGNYAQIYSAGTQNISASGVTLTGGTDGTYNYAKIHGNGDQQISTTTSAGITIQGGAGTSYGNYAQISHGTGGGNQAISIYGGSVTLAAGSGSGTTTQASSPSVFPSCTTDTSCYYGQSVSGDWAAIHSGVGNQSLTFQTAGGVLSISGGSGGNRNQAYISNTGAGTQTVDGFPSITLTGGAYGGNGYTSTDTFHHLRNSASLYSPSGAQTIQANSLTLNGMSAGADPATQATATIVGNGQNITVTNAIALNSGTSGAAYTVITSLLGNQSITAGSIALNAGNGAGVLSGYQGDYAEIRAAGTQNITLTGTGNVLSLVGGGGVGGYDNYARIRQTSATGGSQTITLQGNSTVSLQGGSGSGLLSTSLPDVCSGSTYCDSTLRTSNNRAFINSAYGGQTIDFQQGGSLSLTGGANGVFNLAGIYNNPTSTGQQKITSSNGSAYFPSITLTGGASGGDIATYGGVLAYDAVGVPILLRNHAFIASVNATSTARQAIDASTITLTGAGNSTTYGGASITSPYQSITSTGNISLTAGAGDNATLIGLTTAQIGNSVTAADVQLSIGGSLSLQGGSGNNSGALVGSRQFGATIVADVANDITVSAGVSGSGPVAATIGSSEGHGGSVTLRAGRDIVFGNNTGITSKPGFTPMAPMNVTLLAQRDITLGQITTNPYGGAATLMAGWNGNTTTPALATVAPSGGFGGSINMTGANIQNAGAVSVQAYGALALDSIFGTTILGRAGSGSVTLNSLASLTASGTGDSLVLAAGTNFINNAGASSLSNPAGRWLVYSTNPTLDTRGGLVYDFKQYNLAYPGTPAQATGNGFIYTVAPIITPSLVGSTSKVYDATTTASLTSANYAFTGALDSDTIVLSNPATGTYVDKNAGTGKSVSATVALSGASNGSASVYGYQLSNPTVSAAIGTITPAPLSLNAVTDTRTYNGTTTSVVAPTVSGTVYAGDSLTGVSQSFASKNVLGTNASTLNASYTLSDGNGGNNYAVTLAAAAGTITPLGITGSITAANKTYDATTAATILTRALSGAILGDTVSYSGGTATFDTKDVGTGKTVTGTGLALSGIDAGNYTVNSTAMTLADITALAITGGITGSITAANKTYDGTTAATITSYSLAGVLGTDVVSYYGGTATFDTRNVGIGKTVTGTGLGLTGANAGNYTVNTTATTAADITPLAITGSIAAANKTYDATTAATITARTLAGVLGADVVSYSGGTATFSDKNVATGKTVTGTGLGLAGADAGNYTVNTTATALADITRATLAVSATGQTKVYDATTAATVTLGDNHLGSDVLTLGYGAASFNDKNVGIAKPISVSGITLTGTDAGNYTLSGTTAATTANITARPLSTWIGGATGNWSVASNWDALPDLSNVLAVSVPTGMSVVYDTAAGSTNLATLTAAGLSIAGGTLNIANNLTVSSSFSQTGGTLSFGSSASANITQASGNLNLAAFTVPSLSLNAPAGAITQSGAIIASTLVTTSLTGTTLTDVGNRIAGFTATNSGSGNVALTNTGVLSIGSISNTGGNITIDNTGAVTTVGAVSAPAGTVSIVAHSPLTIGTGGISSGGNITLTAGGTAASTDDLTLNGVVQTTGSASSITLLANDNLLQNANVTTNGGPVSATAETGSITMAPGATTSTSGGGISYTQPSGSATLSSLDAGSGAVTLSAGGSITPVGSATNLTGGSATIAAGGDVTLSAGANLLDVTGIQGTYTIFNPLTGAVQTNAPAVEPPPPTIVPDVEPPPATTEPVVNQVLSTVVATTLLQPIDMTTQTAPPPTTTIAGISSSTLLTDSTQTTGGTTDNFGGTSSSDKPADDKSAKKDDKKDDKKGEGTTAKKDEGKPAAKKLATCS